MGSESEFGRAEKRDANPCVVLGGFNKSRMGR